MDENTTVDRIIENPAWSAESARLCLKAGFKCEYCDLDFLASPDNYKQIQFDHIIPRKIGGPDKEDNFAAVCRTCNCNWKSRWNPAADRPGATRAELVEACRQRIRDERKKAEAEIARLRKILLP